LTKLTHPRIEAARQGQNPSVICCMPSGWVNLADKQYLRGYCILTADPLVESLNALEVNARAQFLTDMALVGDALLEVTGAYRINYAIAGNNVPILHAHIVPRYKTEPEDMRLNHPWAYPTEYMDGTPFDLQHDSPLLSQIREAIARRLK